MASHNENDDGKAIDDLATMDVDTPELNGICQTESLLHNLENGNDFSTSEPSCSMDAGQSVSSAPMNKKRMKKDDSGISVDKFPDEDGDIDDNDEDFSNSSCSDHKTSHKPRPKTLRKCKVKKTEDFSDNGSPDSGLQDSDYRTIESVCGADECHNGPPDAVSSEETAEANSELLTEANLRRENNIKKGYLSDDDDDDNYLAHSSSSDDDDNEKNGASNSKPKHKWFLCQEVANRQYGVSNNFSNDWFRLRAYGSLHMVERLELMYKMKRHEGCVNTLHFNSTGTRLVSGSDDLSIVIWDWAYGAPVLNYDSGHRSNVFQVSLLVSFLKAN